LIFASPASLLLLALPTLGQFGRLLLKVGKFLLERLQPILRGVVLFLLQRLPLDLQLDDPRSSVLDLLRLRFHLHAERDAASSMRSIALSAGSGR
jgi:hypothetical protein